MKKFVKLANLLLATALLLFFNNCGEEFQSISQTSQSSEDTPEPLPPEPTPPGMTPTPTPTLPPMPTPSPSTTPTPIPTPPPTSSSGNLRDAAQSLQAGQWTIFPTQNYNDSTLNESGTIFAFAEEMKWDEQRKEMQYVGAYHYQAVAHLVYNESNNSWSRRPISPSVFGMPFHVYDHMALIPALRTLFVRPFGAGGNVFKKYNLDTQTWSTSSAFNEPRQDGVGAEYFPELGRIVYADAYAIRLYNPMTDTWTKVMDTPTGFGDYHNFVEYSSTHKVVVMGGGNGSRAIYKMDMTGNITRLPDAPVELAVSHTIQTHDPVSGNFLMFGANFSYEFNPSTGVWTRLPASPFESFGGDFPNVTATVAGPIPNYGVIMFAKYAGSGSKVYLYKHK